MTPSAKAVLKSACNSALGIQLVTLFNGPAPYDYLSAMLAAPPFSAPWIAHVGIRVVSNLLYHEALASEFSITHILVFDCGWELSTMRFLVGLILILARGRLNWSKSHFVVIKLRL